MCSHTFLRGEGERPFKLPGDVLVSLPPLAVGDIINLLLLVGESEKTVLVAVAAGGGRDEERESEASVEVASLLALRYCNGGRPGN